MKYLKLFENRYQKIIYSCDEFVLEYNINDYFCMIMDYGQFSGIVGILDLIRKKSDKLNDPKLREIELRIRDINEGLSTFDLYDISTKLNNIYHYRTSNLAHFWGNEYNTFLPIDLYMNFTKEYYPKIQEVLKNNKIFGNIIDEFEVICKEIEEQLEPIEFYKNIEKYNL